MKLSKDTVQKIFLAGLIVCGGIYYYCFEMLGPLTVKEKAATGNIKKMEDQIKDARSKIARERVLENNDPYAEDAKKVFELMHKQIPSGQPVAWLPTHWSEFFKARGIPKQIYRSNPATVNEFDLPGYQLASWTIEFPGIPFSAYGKALAALENQDGLAQVTSFQIGANVKEPENHTAQITFSTFVKSEK